MTTRAMRQLAVVGWTTMALPVVVVVAVVVLAGMYQFRIRGGGENEVSAGTLNRNAVAELQTFDKTPLYWLGEEFGGYRLMSVKIGEAAPATVVDGVEKPAAWMAWAMYGDCDGPPAEEQSCMLPLQVVTTSPGFAPSVEVFTGGDESAISIVRGTKSTSGQGSAQLWLADGTLITIHSAYVELAEAIAALRTANHEAVGIAEIGPGDPLGVEMPK